MYHKFLLIITEVHYLFFLKNKNGTFRIGALYVYCKVVLEDEIVLLLAFSFASLISQTVLQYPGKQSGHISWLFVAWICME